MKVRKISVAALLMASVMLASSCVGSFSLFNKFANWNKTATNSKFLNEIIFLILSPVYAICSLADVLVLNTIEFWSGDNPLASNVGKTQQVMGQDGRYYAVKTLIDGYEITNPDGQMMKLIYNKTDNSWSKIENGEVKELFRFNEDGTIKVIVAEDKTMDVALNNEGLYQVKMAVSGSFWAMR